MGQSLSHREVLEVQLFPLGTLESLHSIPKFWNASGQRGQSRRVPLECVAMGWPGSRKWTLSSAKP